MDLTVVRGALRHIMTHIDQSNRIIARQRKLSPTTVARYRAFIVDQALDPSRLEAMANSEIAALVRGKPHRSNIVANPDWDDHILALQRGHTRAELHARYVTDASSGLPIAYRTYCKRLAEALARREPSMRIVHRAGEKMMVDFAGYCPRGLSGDGQVSPFALFVAIMPVSQYLFAVVVASQKIRDWIAANEAMLRFYGGAATFIVSDNLKSAVISRPRRGPAVIQPDFQMFCDYYGTGALPARPGRPQDKALVENAVKLVQKDLELALADRPPLPLSEINRLLRLIIDRLNDRPMRRYSGATRRTRFEQIDRPLLLPLSANPFVTYDIVKRLKLPADYHVICDGVNYSVPHRLISQPVDIRANATTVEIYHDGKIVAVHPRGGVTGDSATVPSHMPPNHRAWRAADEADLHLWAADRPASVQEVVAAELARGFVGRVRALRFKAFDDLERTVGAERFDAACMRALAVGNPDLGHIRNILERNLESTALPSRKAGSATHPTGVNIRGADYYAEASTDA